VGSILLVEADAQISELWAAAMGAAGHAVLLASAMRDALALIREGGIDVVVIDAHEPAAGIVDLARGIEALPDAPPILLVSSSPAAPDLSVRIGAAVFLAKPVEPDELTAAVGQLIERMRPVRVVEDEPTGPNRQYG
jgi:two-component system, OmpR family, catabolic regulation response regulator CreB